MSKGKLEGSNGVDFSKRRKQSAFPDYRRRSTND